MKSARKLLKKSGISIFIVLIVVGIIRDFCLVPIMSKVWGLTLMTTPEGFISNANIIQSVVRSPWIVFVGFILIMIYALFAMWETSAAILGIAYAYQDQNVKMIDLFRLSWARVRKAAKPANWLILVYAGIILPMSNLYQANEMIGAFVVPEYIEDFINSKTWLWILYTLVGILAVYVALRWLYLLPAFVMKNNSFAEAKTESMSLTRKGWLSNGIRLGIYELIESIRLGIIPFIIVAVTCISCLAFTSELKYSVDLMSTIGFAVGFKMVGALVGRLVYISVMCMLVAGYMRKLEQNGVEAVFDLPELTRQSRQHRSVVFAESWVGLLIAVMVAVAYLPVVYVAETDDSVVQLIFGSTDVVAHKGYSSMAPENTVPAFEFADENEDTDLIELDVWSAKDGIPVVIHNETITAATGLNGNVYDYTSAELHDIPAPYNSDPHEFRNSYIPTLEEVLAAYADSTPILIEIKGYGQDSDLPDKIVALMDKYDCKHTCMIHSQNYQALRAVKKNDPSIKCGLIMAFVSGSCYDLPYADFFSVEHTFLTQGMVSQLHLRGKKIYVWTVNHEDTANELRTMDVDGIITDYPGSIFGNTYSTNDVVSSFVEGNIPDAGNVQESSFDKGEY